MVTAEEKARLMKAQEQATRRVANSSGDISMPVSFGPVATSLMVQSGVFRVREASQVPRSSDDWPSWFTWPSPCVPFSVNATKWLAEVTASAMSATDDEFLFAVVQCNAWLERMRLAVYEIQAMAGASDIGGETPCPEIVAGFEILGRCQTALGQVSLRRTDKRRRIEAHTNFTMGEACLKADRTAVVISMTNVENLLKQFPHEATKSPEAIDIAAEALPGTTALMAEMGVIQLASGKRPSAIQGPNR